MWDFIREKIPASVLAAYLFIAVMSYAYFAVLLGEFGLELLNLLSVFDVALIAFKNPYVLSIIVMLILIAVFYIFMAREQLMPWGFATLMFLAGPVGLGAFLRYTAYADAHYIKTGEQRLLTSLDRNPETRVLLRGGDAVEQVFPVVNTGTYLVFYSRREGNLQIIRRDEVVRLVAQVETPANAAPRAEAAATTDK
jgi:hypothetical protein